MDINRNTTIKSLYENDAISVRTYNCLTYKGYVTIDDVLNDISEPFDLMHLRNFGKKSYVEFSSILSKVMNQSNIINDDEITEDNKDLFDCLERSFESINKANENLSSYIKAKYSSGKDLHNAIIKRTECVLDIEAKLSLEENISLRKLYLKFITDTLSNLEQKPKLDTSIYPIYKRMVTELGLKINDFTLYERAHYFLPTQLHDYIQNTYQKMCDDMLSVRAKNFKDQYLQSFESLINYFDQPLSAYSEICPGRNMRITLKEIFKFNQKFKEIFVRLSNSTEDDITELDLKKRFPFLLYYQRQFVKQFIDKYNHAPLFYIFHEYLRISDDRTDKIFSLQYGLFDNKKRTLSEIALAYNLSRERVRQISTYKTTIQKNIHLFYKDLEYYKDFLSLPYICEDTKDFLQLRNEEQLAFSFEIFASILSLIGEFQTIEINDHTIVINKQSTLAQLNIGEFVSNVESLINSKFAQETSIPIDNILKPQSSVYELSKQLATFILVKIFNLNIENDSIIFEQNYIDISEELYQILYEKGEPMSVDDIFVKFKDKYPEHAFTDSLQIKQYLYKNEHIRSIGRMSLYGLDSWKKVYYGSIRDLMYEIISNSETPVHIGEIYEKVTEYFPETNIKSIASSMQSDTTSRFISFVDGYFGVKDKSYSEELSHRQINQRYSFEERMKHFREFVETYHRFPLSNGGEEEASLRRWYYNVENCIIDAPSEEALDNFLKMIEEFHQKAYPRTGYEAEFLNNCQNFQEFINTNYKLPSAKNGTELYWWLRRSLENYDSYIDLRRLYLTSLINYIHSLGFNVYEKS